MMDDLDLSENDWTWVLQSFYICYVLFEWTVLFWKILPAHIYVATLCFLYVPMPASTVNKLKVHLLTRTAMSLDGEPLQWRLALPRTLQV